MSKMDLFSAQHWESEQSRNSYIGGKAVYTVYKFKHMLRINKPIN